VCLCCEPRRKSLWLAKLAKSSREAIADGSSWAATAAMSAVLSPFEGWDRVDVQDDTGDRSARFEYKFAEVVGDQADFHALLNIEC